MRTRASGAAWLRRKSEWTEDKWPWVRENEKTRKRENERVSSEARHTENIINGLE